MTRHYLSLADFARRIGVSRSTVKDYRLPEPDVTIGSGAVVWRGWSAATIDQWNAQRRGRGNRHPSTTRT